MGYINDTHMAMYVPCSLFHFSTGTITEVAGQVAGTIVMHRAAGDQTTLITVPVLLPSNSSARKGSKLLSVEIDYEILTAEPTAITFAVNKVTRGADGADAVVAAVAATAALDGTESITVDEHKQVLTIDDPFYIDDGEYVLVEMALEAGAGGNTADFLGAVVKYEERL